MADNNFEIFIRILSQQVGNEKAQDILKQVRAETDKATAATKESSNAVEQSTIKHSELKKAANLLGSELGVVGRLLSFVFNPGILGAAALATAIGKVKDAFFDFMSGLAGVAANAARGIGDIKGAMVELEIERAKADVNWKTSMEDFERAAKRRIELINLEKTTALQLIAARESADLAAAKNPEESEAIKRRYGSARTRADANATRQEIAAREDELKGLDARANARNREGLKQSGGRNKNATELALKKMPKELADLDDQIAKQEAATQQMSGITSDWGALPYWNDGENYLTQVQAYRDSLATLAALKRTRKNIAGRQLPLTQAATAFVEAEGLGGRVRTGRQDLANFRDDTNIRDQTGWVADATRSGRGDDAEMISSAAGGADVIRAGGQASAQQKAALAAAQQAFGLVGQNSATILAVLSQMNNSQQQFATALEGLRGQVKNIQSRP